VRAQGKKPQVLSRRRNASFKVDIEVKCAIGMLGVVILLMGDSSPRFHALFLTARFTMHVSASATHSMYTAKFGSRASFVSRHSLLHCARFESRDCFIQFVMQDQERRAAASQR
jgi:hypothetical protein